MILIFLIKRCLCNLFFKFSKNIIFKIEKSTQMCIMLIAFILSKHESLCKVFFSAFLCIHQCLCRLGARRIMASLCRGKLGRYPGVLWLMWLLGLGTLVACSISLSLAEGKRLHVFIVIKLPTKLSVKMNVYINLGGFISFPRFHFTCT